jgi:hypothetical protein
MFMSMNDCGWLTLTMTPSLVVALLFAVLCPALNNALALPSSSYHAGRKGGFLVPNFLCLHRGDAADIRRCCRGSLMIMRGGGNDDDESESDDYEYDVSSSSDDAEEEITDSSDSEEESDQEDTESPDSNDQTEIELLQKQADLSQQSRNFGIATALWSSLFFDSILNKAKRIDLFPTTASIIIPPASKLAVGFATAASVAFLLWRDYEIQSETLGGEESTKGDWFLSLSNNDKSEESEAFVSETRQRLLFHLSLFGLLNLACHDLPFRIKHHFLV